MINPTKRGPVLLKPFLCMEFLSLLIEKAVNNKSWKPFVLKATIKISHLSFVDDALLLDRADVNSCKYMKNVVHKFESLWG